REVVVNSDGAIGRLHLAFVMHPLADRDIDVPRDHGPGGFVIFVRKLSTRGVEMSERRGETARAAWTASTSANFGEAVALLPFFDQHLPVFHLHRGDGEFGTWRERGRPIERHGEALRGKERPVSRMLAGNQQILELDTTEQQPKTQ